MHTWQVGWVSVVVLLAGCAESLEDEVTLDWEVAPADAVEAPPGNLTISIPALLPPGSSATVDVSEATWYELTYIVRGSSEGSGPCVGAFGGLCLGVAPPVALLTSFYLDIDGTGSTAFPTPSAVGTQLCLQAGIQRGPGAIYSELSNVACGIVDNDGDGDGVGDLSDVCPGHDDAVDTDGDGQPDGCDACPFDNPDDPDGDGECGSPADYDWAGSHVFTTCGRSSQLGPDLADCLVEYATAPWTADPANFDVIDGIQYWTVPVTGTYAITAQGAQGGDTSSSGAPGFGAMMKGDFTLSGGQVLQILVGQQPDFTGLHSGGGGGGSFVVDVDSGSPLIIAGGGSGATNDSNPGRHGLTTTSGGDSTSGQVGGVDGLGGEAGDSGTGNGSGGGGMYGDGEDGDLAAFGTRGGDAFVNGGAGGDAWDIGSRGSHGGFGAGGGCGNYGSGGGGGYSGGAAGQSNGHVGGGGGSWNVGTNQDNLEGENAGHGRVTITLL